MHPGLTVLLVGTPGRWIPIAEPARRFGADSVEVACRGFKPFSRRLNPQRHSRRVGIGIEKDKRDSGTDSSFNAVWCADAHRVWVIGENGTSSAAARTDARIAASWYLKAVSDGTKAPPSKVMKTIPAIEATSTVSHAVVQAAKAPHRPMLVVISGNDVGTRRPLDQSVFMGRDPSCELVLNDALVSSRHAMVEDRGDSWTLVDLGSTNGTSVNGEKGKEFALSPNDKIALGRTIVRFEMQDSLEQAFNEIVTRLLNVDDLSGLLVRRKFDADLKLAVDAARAQATPLGLLMMDLDGIKKINDANGHLFGAYVIGESGRLIGNVLGTRGFASRFGGDEYVAALPGLDLGATCRAAEEVRLAIANHRFERENVPLRPGISIGVASFPESADDAENLFKRADEALYRAKRAGKNQVSR